MGEVNEKDLVWAAGNASAVGSFSRMNWYNLNCLYCANKGQCRSAKVKAALQEAERQAKEGVEWVCPDKC